MSEKVAEKIERLNLASLKVGDQVHVTTGEAEEAFKYTFTVSEAGMWPIGHLQELAPNGEITGEGTFMLQGSGIWTDRTQNPVQTQNRAFTSYFCDLSLNTYMVGSHPNTPANRMVFYKPGQAISEVIVSPSLL